jgi:hypothetical protein
MKQPTLTDVFEIRRREHECYRAAREATILLMPVWLRVVARLVEHRPNVRWLFFHGAI